MTSCQQLSEPEYAAYRTRVALAHRRLQGIVAARHAPSEARRAADELSEALREATSAVQRLRQRCRDPLWSRELARLTDIAVWLRRTTLDDLGVRLPTTVRVGNCAAKGPNIAGLGSSAIDRAELYAPRIGIDLAATVDRQDSRPSGT